jgi:hypothetical protein
MPPILSNAMTAYTPESADKLGSDRFPTTIRPPNKRLQSLFLPVAQYYVL